MPTTILPNALWPTKFIVPRLYCPPHYRTPPHCLLPYCLPSLLSTTLSYTASLSAALLSTVSIVHHTIVHRLIVCCLIVYRLYCLPSSLYCPPHYFPLHLLYTGIVSNNRECAAVLSTGIVFPAIVSYSLTSDSSLPWNNYVIKYKIVSYTAKI